MRKQYDRVFNILHGNNGGGEDGVLQGLLEALGVPYTGSGVLGSALSMDKIRTKQVWLSLGLPTPRYARLTKGDDVHAAARAIGLPVIVKPACEGSSVGVSRVFTDADLDDAVALAKKYPGELLVEQMIEGDEFTVGILGDVALPSIRIVPKGQWYDYHAKYVAEDTQYLCPGLEGADEDEIPRKERLRWEKELLGLYLSEHPLGDIARSFNVIALYIYDSYRNVDPPFCDLAYHFDFREFTARHFQVHFINRQFEERREQRCIPP